MDSRDMVVIGMSGLMIAIGLTIIRLSKRDRAMGGIAVLIGVGALIAYFAGDDGERALRPVATPIDPMADPFGQPATPSVGA